MRSLYPLSPLQRGFALLKLGDHLLTNDESLSELAGTFAKVEIVRSSEIAQASIEEVIKKVYDQTE